MKILPASLLIVSFVSCLGSLPAAGGKDVEVLDFLRMNRNSDGTYEKGYDYAYQDWETKAVQIPQKGLLVNLTGSKGGLGADSGPDFGKHTKARISFVLSSRSRAKSFSFTLVDRDGTDQSFYVPLENLARGVELAVIVDLTKPSKENNPGRTPGLNLKKLKTWQLGGDYQEEPIEILFLRVMAIPD